MKIRRGRLAQALLASLIFSDGGLASAASSSQVQEFRLANGLKVIVKEDHRAPTVAHMVWYRTGSMDEHNGTTGVAHVLEHMMFQGTKAVKAGDFSARVAQLGGRENAFTSKDYTAYFQQVEKSRLPQMMALEADRMQNLQMDAAKFAKEIQVVMEERRLRTDDQPTAKVYEALYATAFNAHPYHNPIVGWMDDLQNMTAADAIGWYKRWYAPNNATLVVTGDVDAAQVRALAEKYYGKIPAKTLPQTRPQNEPPQAGVRRVEVKAPAENPYLVMAYKVPSIRDVEADDDGFALDVLAAVLDGYDNARLPAKLVRTDRVANSVGAGYDGIQRGPALFLLDGVPAQGTSVAELEERLRAEVARVASEGVSADELKRVKAQLIAGQVYKRDSVFGQAMEIGPMEMSGVSAKKIDRIIERLAAVTPEQVRDVARRYFGDDQLTVATLTPLPLEAGEKPAPKAVPGMRH